MNPLGVSLIFVICSIFLSFLKHTFFPSQSTNTVSKFNKVFQLANTKFEPTPKYYKSLYEAYHKTQTVDAKQYTQMLQNRNQFNESVLKTSMLNQEKSIMCGEDYLILLRSGITTFQGMAKWTNTFMIYSLPLLSQLRQVNFEDRLLVAKTCKKYDNTGKFQLGVITKNGPVLIIISSKQANVLQNFQYDYSLSQSIDIFDIDSNYFVSWSKNRPWIISVEQSSTSQTKLEIDLLIIQQENSAKSTQSLNVHHIFITKKAQTYITVIYDIHYFGQKQKYFKTSVFVLKDKKVSLLNMAILENSSNFQQQIQLQCVLFTNQKSSQEDICCIFHRFDQNLAKLAYLHNIFSNITTAHPPNNTQKQSEDKINDLLLELQNNGYPYDWPQEDYQALIENQSQSSLLPINDTTFHKFYLIFHSPTYSPLKILKPSLPDPILSYFQGKNHILFTFNVPADTNLEQFSMGSSQFSFSSDNKQNPDNYLRHIEWIDSEKLIVVVWANSIQVYKFECYDFPQYSGEGVTMAVILPFVELFATVFCLLRMVWSNE